MSEHLEAAMDQFRQGRRRKYGPYDVTKPPTDDELAGQTPEQRVDFSLFSPQQLEQETRTVRLIGETCPGHQERPQPQSRSPFSLWAIMALSVRSAIRSLGAK